MHCLYCGTPEHELKEGLWRESICLPCLRKALCEMDPREAGRSVLEFRRRDSVAAQMEVK